jgi:hypothetical protein
MAFKLLAKAQERWRRLNAPHLMEFVALGVRFEEGKIADPAIAQAVERALQAPSTPSLERVAA